MLRAALAALLAVPALVGAAPAPATWTGSFTLPASAQPVTLSLAPRGARVLVVLGNGHPAPTLRPLARQSGGRISFTVPGRPVPLRFDGRVRGATLAGSVSAGALRGTFSLGRRALSEDASLGIYRLAGGETLAVARPQDQRWATVYETGELRGLFRRGGGRYDIGSGLAARAPVAGTARFSGDTVVWNGVRGRRLPLRQEEVRFRSRDGVLLAGTLMIPPGGGKHPAVAIVHGSGATDRGVEAARTDYFAARGFVVLSYDKRGVGQSGGTWPGERASERAIDLYARDAEAGARFLAAQPEADRARVGLAGASQAGWIMPLAASREDAIRFLVLLVSPTVTQGESDDWGGRTGQGDRDPGNLSAIEAEVRRDGPSGFDPLPAIRALRIPALWIFGEQDLNVPTRLSVERLEPLTRERGRDFSYVVLPRAAHALVDSDHGLNDEVLRSHRFADGLWSTIDGWLERHGLRG